MSKKVVVSKQQLTKQGEELEAVGTVAEVVGAVAVAEGLENLSVAQTAVQVGVKSVAAASSDLTRAADAAIVSEKVQELSDIVGAAGVNDVEQGVDLLLQSDNVKAMGAIVSLMSNEELERGMELARLAGELSVAGGVVDVLDMPVLAEFLAERGARLQEIAVDQLLRYTGTRALAGALKDTGKEIEEMGQQEVEEGLVRVAVSEVAAERSAQLAAASDALASRATDELITAAIAREVAQEAVVEGVTAIAEGSAVAGAGEATAAMGEALDARAQQ
jgi:hypothetical protein